MNFDHIIKLFDSHGIQGLLLTIGALVYWIFDNTFGVQKIITRFFYKFFEVLLKRKFTVDELNEVHMKHISESDIVNHDIFNYLNFWVYSKIPTLEFASEFRTVVFRKYLTIYLKKHKEIFKRFIEEKGFTEMDDTQLWNTLLSLINEIIFDYETEMLASGIPRIIIEKMKSRNNERILLTIDLIEGICNSQFYDSEKNLLKIYSILNILLSVLENTISNSENVCNSINGQLKGLKFRDGDKDITEP